MIPKVGRLPASPSASVDCSGFYPYYHGLSHDLLAAFDDLMIYVSLVLVLVRESVFPLVVIEILMVLAGSIRRSALHFALIHGMVSLGAVALDGLTFASAFASASATLVSRVLEAFFVLVLQQRMRCK